MPGDPVTPHEPRPTTRIDPSRAWILGAVVSPDGTVSGPPRTPEWPSCECPDDCPIDHENA